MVVGTSKKRAFRLTNVGKLPMNFSFDKKLLQSLGLSVDPDKVQGLQSSTSV